MNQFIRHDIPTAVSVELHVRQPQCPDDAQAARSTEPYRARTLMPVTVTARSLMQITRRWQRTVQPPPVEAQDVPAEHVADHHQIHPAPIEPCEMPMQQMLAGMILPWPATWRTIQEVWNYFFGQRAEHVPTSLSAEVWFSDHQRRPWSDCGRVVALPSDFAQWTHVLTAAWSDWILPSIGYDMFVVVPSPLGGENPVRFHVLLIQQSMPDHFSCLITVMDRFADPWIPNHICVVLPHAVDHWLLLHAAVVEGPRIDQSTRCRSLYGSLELTAGNLFPVQHAMCFTVTVDALDVVGPQNVATPQLQPEADNIIEAAAFFQVRMSKKSAPVVAHTSGNVVDHLIEDASALLATLPDTISYHCTALTGTIDTFQSDILMPQMPVERRTSGQVAHTQRPAEHTLRPLLLEELLPPPPKVHVDLSLAAKAKIALQGCPIDIFCPWQAEVPIPDVTQTALQALIPHSTDQAPLALHFYVDGSKVRDHQVGAAVVLL